MPFESRGARQHVGSDVGPAQRRTAPLGMSGEEAADASGAREAEAPAHRDRRVHPQAAGAAERTKGVDGGMRLLGSPAAVAADRQTDLEMERQGHAEGVEAGAEVGRRRRHADDHGGLDAATRASRAAAARPSSRTAPASSMPAPSESTAPPTSRPAAAFSTTTSRCGPGSPARTARAQPALLVGSP